MPGRLMAEKDIPTGQPPLQHAAKHSLVNGVKPATPAAPPRARTPQDAISKSSVPNGSSTAGPPAKLSAAMGLPPEIEHITDNFWPMADLYRRIAQQCFSDLIDLIEAMPPPPPLLPQVNGASSLQPPTAPVSSENAERRRRWMDFGKHHRDRFIKLLVLTRWLDKVDDIGKLIDLNNHLAQDEIRQTNVLWNVEHLIQDLLRIRVSSPDVETAVSVLSRGEDPRVPTLRFIPPKPLTAAKALSTMREMNALLHIRLNRDETLPSYLRNFSVKSGRASFTIPTEFELDVYVAQEDPASPFCFADLRFLFTPNIEIPQLFFNQLDLRINGILQQQGLLGCFNMLHEFVLTHKINLMKRQAVTLNSSTWAGTIRVEHIHRSLVIQYWRERPGKKSWLEIGVNMGTLPGQQRRSKEAIPPQLGARWFIAGKQVLEARLDIPQQELNVETTLRCAVAQHISRILAAIRTSGKGKVQTSDTNPDDCYLEIPFGDGHRQQTLKVLMDYRSGRFVLQPWTELAVHYEKLLNELRNPEEEAWPLVVSFRQAIMRDEVERLAQQDGMAVVRDLDLRGKVNAQRTSVFQPHFWTSQWNLAYLITEDRESWAAIKTNNAGAFAKRSVESVVPVCGATSQRPAAIAIYAAKKLSAMSLQRELNRKGLRHQFLPTFGNQPPTVKVDISSIVPGMAIRLSLLGPSVHPGHRHLSQAEPKPVTYKLEGKLPLNDALTPVLDKIPSSEMQFKADGSFTMIVEHEMGSATLLEDSLARLQSLSRLQSLLDAVHDKHLNPEAADTEAVVFSYAPKHPSYKARLGFSLEQGGLHVSFLPRANPHRRMARVINRWLGKGIHATNNEKTMFGLLIDVLQQTLPAMQALDEMERKDRAGLMNIDLVSPECLRVDYGAGGAGFELMVRRNAMNRPLWIISKMSVGSRPTPATSEYQRAETQLQELLKGGGGSSTWKSYRHAIAVPLDDVVSALTQLDAVLRAYTTSVVSSRGGAADAKGSTGGKATSKPPAAAAAVNGTRAKATGGKAAKQGPNVKEEQRDVVVLD